jgi:hypothetical protein
MYRSQLRLSDAKVVGSFPQDYKLQSLDGANDELSKLFLGILLL